MFIRRWAKDDLIHGIVLGRGRHVSYCFERDPDDAVEIPERRGVIDIRGTEHELLAIANI